MKGQETGQGKASKRVARQQSPGLAMSQCVNVCHHNVSIVIQHAASVDPFSLIETSSIEDAGAFLERWKCRDGSFDWIAEFPEA